MLEKKRKSSACKKEIIFLLNFVVQLFLTLAKVSPRQTLFPIENGMKCSSFFNCTFGITKYVCVHFTYLSIIINKSLRMESGSILPMVTLIIKKFRSNIGIILSKRNLGSVTTWLYLQNLC